VRCWVYACSTCPDYCYSIQIHGSPSIVSIAFMALLRWNRKYARGIGGKRGQDSRWIVSDFVRAMNEANRVKLAWVSGWLIKATNWRWSRCCWHSLWRRSMRCCWHSLFRCHSKTAAVIKVNVFQKLCIRNVSLTIFMYNESFQIIRWHPSVASRIILYCKAKFESKFMRLRPRMSFVFIVLSTIADHESWITSKT
jgi:hypothetical protein